MHLEAQSPSRTRNSAPNFSRNTQATSHNYSRSQSQFEKKKYKSHRALSDLTRNYFPMCYLQHGASPPAEQAACDACLQSCQGRTFFLRTSMARITGGLPRASSCCPAVSISPRAPWQLRSCSGCGVFSWNHRRR